MEDKRLNDLLKWSINASTQKEDNTTDSAPVRSPNADAIAALLGGPSDADLMVAAMENVMSPDPEITLESKLTALDNLEQLIESLDNANLLSKLGLWTPLLELLAHDEDEIRRMAAWVVGTAVQNNEPSQERLVALGGLEKLVAMVLGERVAKGDQAVDAAAEPEKKDVRRKAVYAVSSACRNYQPAMDVVSKELAKREGKEADKVDAANMDAVDVVINGLREKVASA
ncbi:Hsp70 nucleotide exchange factor [Pestalotiopsis fici W106-1]|uniref:Hsp70 nucleotide exchange factor n=1 Tax=Pestalotiopsis fici (strain W106-1 / CGMCC3.15140) TaxID=1229662 RepID=W3X499_PESFW|nr:Hsp70 nucleotide exchange factor [Pestalotiopsis fici W106-1]ETS80212.1 Hsp70 nucleotide exchange factor [Pestalotiopsis fici W106-1]